MDYYHLKNFVNIYLDLIKNKIDYFKDYYSLIYNNLLEYIINNIEEFDINSNNIFSNLYKISKKKYINFLYLLILIKYLFNF